MYTLGPDEKATMVMAYTQDSLIRGETVNKQTVRVSMETVRIVKNLPTLSEHVEATITP